MKNRLLVFIFVIFAANLYAQEGPVTLKHEIPEWVLDLDKTNINIIELTRKYNEFWKDKRIAEKEGSTGFEADAMPIKEEFGWLRKYIHQYEEVIAAPYPRIGNFKSENTKTLSAQQFGMWTLAGPKNSPTYQNAPGLPFGIGRINQIAFSAINSNVIYALASSGLFISVDTGNTWQSTGTDFIGMHEFRGLAVDPTNDSIIYLGSGDYFSNSIFDSGVLKSTDFGNTFTPLLNGMDSTQITTIRIDPQNSGHVVAGGKKGIWWSNNAGQSWQHTYQMTTTNNLIYDIKFKPGSSDTLYATTKDTFLISTNGGSTWSAGFNNFQFVTSFPFNEELLLGVCDAAPDYIYIATLQDFGNIYKSTDGGITFSAVKKYTTPGLIGYDTLLNSFGQGDYDFTFNADPFDSLKLYIGSISLYSSNDGGVTWHTPYSQWASYTQNTNLHCDQHFVARNPLLPDRIWVANDGGVYVKLDTDSIYNAKHNNLSVTQAFHFEADNFYDSTYVMGTQDNAAMFTNDGDHFYSFLGGDVYTKFYSLYNSSITVIASGGNKNLHNGNGGYPLNIPEDYELEPMSFTPVTPLTGFVANKHIWETNDLGASSVQWRKIFHNTDSNNIFVSTNHCLADTTIFYALRMDGYLFRTFNALDINPGFDSILLPCGPTSFASLATVTNNDSVLYLSTYNTVYQSNDYGLTWNIIKTTSNLMGAFFEIVSDPYSNDGSLYLAEGNKIYYRNDTSAWIDFSNQLPNIAPITSIVVKRFTSQVRKVMAIVRARGIWQSPVFQQIPSGVVENQLVEEKFVVFPNPSSGSVTIINDALNIDQIIIFNSNGQQVCVTKNNLCKSRITLDLTALQHGVYFMEIHTANGIAIKRLVLSW